MTGPGTDVDVDPNESSDDDTSGTNAGARTTKKWSQMKEKCTDKRFNGPGNIQTGL